MAYCMAYWRCTGGVFGGEGGLTGWSTSVNKYESTHATQAYARIETMTTTKTSRTPMVACALDTKHKRVVYRTEKWHTHTLKKGGKNGKPTPDAGAAAATCTLARPIFNRHATCTRTGPRVRAWARLSMPKGRFFRFDLRFRSGPSVGVSCVLGGRMCWLCVCFGRPRRGGGHTVVVERGSV